VHGDWSYRPTSNKWRLSVAWIWHSGWPYTPAVVHIDTLENSSTRLNLFATWHPGEINSARLPAYHRTDVRWTRFFETRAGQVALFAEVYNLLNAKNPRGYHTNLHIDNQRRVILTRGSESNIPRLPVVGVTWEF
jgi:hypothetical protein